ncbi:hypothetical protein ADK52_17245 [Streptomyces sp. WM6372]|nr:hypothetical protein ADK52_17245 [Streptomyces sp. WM6372]
MGRPASRAISSATSARKLPAVSGSGARDSHVEAGADRSRGSGRVAAIFPEASHRPSPARSVSSYRPMVIRPSA